MAKILGLDLGTNSVGWAVVDTEKLISDSKVEQVESILACGSRVFKEGVNKNSAGKEVSKNAAKRIARGTRIKNRRFKSRRKRLILELSKLGMMPTDKHYSFTKKDKKNHTRDLFELRKRVLDEKLQLEEIGRIFLQINNHRGFKSNKKEDALTKSNPDKEKELAGVKGRIKKLEKRISDCNCRTIGEYYFYLIDRNKDSHNPNAPRLEHEDDMIRGEGAYTSRNLYAKEFDTIWKKQKEYYPEILTDENREIIEGECIFYQRDLRSARHLRNRCRLEYKGYRWINSGGEKVKQYNYLPCCPKSSFEFQEYRIWEQLNKIRYTNTEHIHEPLSLEQKQKLADKLMYCEKLSLAQVKKIALLSRDTKFNDVDKELKGNVTQTRLINALGKDFWLKHSAVVEESCTASYSKVQYQLWHNIEFSKDKEWLKGDNYFLNNRHRYNSRQANRANRKYKSHQNWLNSIKNLGLTKGQLCEYSETTFEPGYASLSLKAIRKLLPYLKNGEDPVSASYKVYGDYSSTIQSADTVLEFKVPQLSNNTLKNPVVEKAVKEAIKLVNAIIDKYGKPDMIHLEMTRDLKMPKEHRENIRRRNQDKDKAREEYSEFLSKRLSRNIDKTSPEIKKFEMFLQLNYTTEGFNNNIKGQISESEIKRFLALRIPTNKTKYHLWLECDRKDPYEGRPINLETLFSSDIEIEHIIPYSISGDDSFANKTLSFKSFNAKKGKLTPMQYFVDKPDQLDLFKKNISNFPDNKKDRFLLEDDKIEGFKNSQLNSTSYISTEVRKHLLRSYKNENIILTNGTMTSLVRTLLGFNGILNKAVRVEDCYRNMGKVWAIVDDFDNITDFIPRNENKEPENTKTIKGVINHFTFFPSKSRNDHRHHAVDALVTAILNRKINTSILKLTEGVVDVETGEFFPKFYTNEKGEHRLTREAVGDIKSMLQEELNLVEMDDLLPIAKEKIEYLLVSYQNRKLVTYPRKKLFEPNGRPLRTKDGRHLRSGGISERAELHEANYYGKTNDCSEGEFVRRVPLSSITPKQVDNIVDKVIKCIVRTDREKEEELNSKLKELNAKRTRSSDEEESEIEKQIEETLSALNQLYKLPNKNGEKVPIQKVRVKFKTSTAQPLKSEKIVAQLTPNYRKSIDTTKYQYIKPGNNYMYVIYGDAEGESRDKHVVSWFDKAQIDIENRRLKKQVKATTQKPELLPYYPIKELPVFCTLQHNDMVIMYDETPEEINWDDEKELFNRLFTLVKFTEAQLSFMRHNVSGIDADKGQSVVNILSGEGQVKRPTANTFRGIKVTINELGEIEEF
nr:type II CRISPR RNA-guided endonuclease Cas9 [uncultured Draconibacterium sp.]